MVHNTGAAVDCIARHRRQRSRRAGNRSAAGKAAVIGHTLFTNLLRGNIGRGIVIACDWIPYTAKYSDYFTFSMHIYK